MQNKTQLLSKPLENGQQILVNKETGMPALLSAISRESSQSPNRIKMFFATPVVLDGEDSMLPVTNPQGFRLEMN